MKASIMGSALAVACLGMALHLGMQTRRQADGQERNPPPSSLAGMQDRPASSRRPRLPADPAAKRDPLRDWLDSLALSGSAAAAPPGTFAVPGLATAARKSAVATLLARMTAGNAAGLYDKLSSLQEPPGTLTDPEWGAFFQRWGQLDAPGALECLASAAGSGGRIPDVIRGWASLDPHAASAWLGVHSGGEEAPPWLNEAIGGFLVGWMDHDPGAAARWLGGNRQEPWYGAVATAFSRQVATLDPAGAWQSATTVEGPLREQAITEAAAAWLRSGSPAAAPGIGSSELLPPATLERLQDPAASIDLLEFLASGGGLESSSGTLSIGVPPDPVD